MAKKVTAPRAKRLKVGELYEITLKDGSELFGYEVYEKNGDNYVVGYDGVDDVRITINVKDIKVAEKVDV